jgi:hypothetical protein
MHSHSIQTLPTLIPIFNQLSFVQTYISLLDDQLSNLPEQAKRLSKAQKLWLGFILSAIIITNSICWDRFARISGGKFKASRLLQMFSRTRGFWDYLLTASTKALLSRFEISEAVLVLDDSDKRRSKKCHKLHAVHKVKDKGTGGYAIAQNVIFLVLVTKGLTIPVGFKFYEPDLEWSKWSSEDRKLRKCGISKANRPSEPEKKNKSKSQLASELVIDFFDHFPEVDIRAICADCLYGNKKFSAPILAKKKVQIISQIRSNQTVYIKNKAINLEELIRRYPGIKQTINFREEDKDVIMYGVRVGVKSYDGEKLFVIALKYEGEDDYRYITGSDLSWRAIDIVSAYSLRWLVEVFIQDWKGHMGFDRMAIHQGVKGSSRGVILSLLVDHALNTHPKQSALIKSEEPASTVGTLIDHIKVEAFLETLKDILNSDSPKEKYEDMANALTSMHSLRESKKHLYNLDISKFKGKSYLAKKFEAAA